MPIPKKKKQREPLDLSKSEMKKIRSFIKKEAAKISPAQKLHTKRLAVRYKREDEAMKISVTVEVSPELKRLILAKAKEFGVESPKNEKILIYDVMQAFVDHELNNVTYSGIKDLVENWIDGEPRDFEALLERQK